MKVLLLQFVKNVGREGEIKEVADGMAVNQLIPRKLAVAATKQVIAQYEQKKNLASQKDAQVKNDFSNQIKKVKGKKLIMKVQTNDKGVLYQSITPGLIRSFLRDQHSVIVPENAIKTKPIRDIGEHVIAISALGIQDFFTLLVQRA